MASVSFWSRCTPRRRLCCHLLAEARTWITPVLLVQLPARRIYFLRYIHIHLSTAVFFFLNLLFSIYLLIYLRCLARLLMCCAATLRDRFFVESRVALCSLLYTRLYRYIYIYTYKGSSTSRFCWVCATYFILVLFDFSTCFFFLQVSISECAIVSTPIRVYCNTGLVKGKWDWHTSFHAHWFCRFNIDFCAFWRWLRVLRNFSTQYKWKMLCHKLTRELDGKISTDY